MKEAPNRNGSSQCCPMKVGEHCWPGSLRAMFCDAHTALLTHTQRRQYLMSILWGQVLYFLTCIVRKINLSSFFLFLFLKNLSRIYWSLTCGRTSYRFIMQTQRNIKDIELGT